MEFLIFKPFLLLSLGLLTRQHRLIQLVGYFGLQQELGQEWVLEPM